jgi:Ca2+-binding RTX toxin-like protein
MNRRLRFGRAWGAAGLVGMLAALAVASPPAGAAVVCEIEDTIFDDQLAIRTDVDITLTTEDEQLFVNGELCGDMTVVPSVYPTGPLDIVIDVSSTWRFDGGDSRPTLNVFALDRGSTISWIGSPVGDSVTVIAPPKGKITVDFMTRPSGSSELAAVVHEASAIDMTFDLGDGWDRYAFSTDGGEHTGVITVHGGRGRDRIDAGPGRQRVYGGPGADRISGGPGRDWLYGNRGSDVLNGDAGRDRLFGNAGRDVMIGGPGRDRAVGGPGRDHFQMLDDTVDRFTLGQRDRCTCDPTDVTS